MWYTSFSCTGYRPGTHKWWQCKNSVNNTLTTVLYQRPQCAAVRVWTANRTQPHIFQWSHTNYTDLVHNHWNARKYSFIIKLVIVSCNYLHRLPISEDKLYTQFLFTLVEPKFIYRSVLKLATHIEFVKRFVIIGNTIVLERLFPMLYCSNKRSSSRGNRD